MFSVNPLDWRANDEHPELVLFHGGWKSGQPTQFDAHCEHFATLGFVPIQAQYRLPSDAATPPLVCV